LLKDASAGSDDPAHSQCRRTTTRCSRVPQRPVRPLALFAVLAFSTLSLALPVRASAAAEPQSGQDSRPPPDLTGIVKDTGWARILGKALFWDTVASANGSDCASCHFVTGANRHIRDQSGAPLQLLRAAIDGPAAGSPLRALSANDPNGIVDVCARHVRARSAELPDFGPMRTAGRVADEDPSSHEDLTARLARSFLNANRWGTVRSTHRTVPSVRTARM